MEINLSKESLRKWGITALFVLALFGGGYWLAANGVLARFIPAAQPAEEAVLPPGGEVAARGVEMSYTLDYEEPDAANAWLERYCAISTVEGCGYAEAFLLPSVKMALERNSIQTTCTAEAIVSVDGGTDSRDLRWEAWLVRAVLSDPWKGQDQEQDVYAYIVYVDDEWRFERLLSQREASIYVQESDK